MRRSRRNRRRSLALNAAGILAAFALLAFALNRNSPALLAHAAGSSLAAATISVSAGVPANPYNTLAAQLQAKQAQLDQEQQSLQAQAAPVDMLGVYSLFVSIALFVLVAFNFYFDWKRTRTSDGRVNTFSVDLKSR